MQVSELIAEIHRKVDALLILDDMLEVNQLLDSMLSEGQALSPENAFRRVSRYVPDQHIEMEAGAESYLEEEPEKTPAEEAKIWLHKP